jgi:chromosome segregation ATPase
VKLRTFIKAEKAATTPVQQHSTSAELVQTLERIARLEHAQSDNSEHFGNINHYMNIKEDQVAILQDRLGGYEYQISQQQKQIEKLMDIVSTLQSEVCKLNERTINQDVQIKQLSEAHDEASHLIQELVLQRAVSDRLYEDQAQHLDALHEQINSQLRPAEQIVKIVVEQPAPRQRVVATKTEIIRIGNECKYGNNTVKVVGNSAAGCDCSKGSKGLQCDHMIEVDKFLSK